MADKNLQIRNSTVDFLIFTRDAKEKALKSVSRMEMSG